MSTYFTIVVPSGVPIEDFVKCIVCSMISHCIPNVSDICMNRTSLRYMKANESEIQDVIQQQHGWIQICNHVIRVGDELLKSNEHSMLMKDSTIQRITDDIHTCMSNTMNVVDSVKQRWNKPSYRLCFFVALHLYDAMDYVKMMCPNMLVSDMKKIESLKEDLLCDEIDEISILLAVSFIGDCFERFPVPGLSR